MKKQDKRFFVCREKLKYEMTCKDVKTSDLHEALRISRSRFSILLNQEGFREFQIRIMSEVLGCDESDILE